MDSEPTVGEGDSEHESDLEQKTLNGQKYLRDPVQVGGDTGNAESVGCVDAGDGRHKLGANIPPFSTIEESNENKLPNDTQTQDSGTESMTIETIPGNDEDLTQEPDNLLENQSNSEVKLKLSSSPGQTELGGPSPTSSKQTGKFDMRDLFRNNVDNLCGSSISQPVLRTSSSKVLRFKSETEIFIIPNSYDYDEDDESGNTSPPFSAVKHMDREEGLSLKSSKKLLLEEEDDGSEGLASSPRTSDDNKDELTTEVLNNEDIEKLSISSVAPSEASLKDYDFAEGLVEELIVAAVEEANDAQITYAVNDFVNGVFKDSADLAVQGDVSDILGPNDAMEAASTMLNQVFNFAFTKVQDIQSQTTTTTYNDVGVETGHFVPAYWENRWSDEDKIESLEEEEDDLHKTNSFTQINFVDEAERLEILRQATPRDKEEIPKDENENKLDRETNEFQYYSEPATVVLEESNAKSIPEQEEELDLETNEEEFEILEIPSEMEYEEVSADGYYQLPDPEDDYYSCPALTQEELDLYFVSHTPESNMEKQAADEEVEHLPSTVGTIELSPEHYLSDENPEEASDIVPTTGSKYEEEVVSFKPAEYQANYLSEEDSEVLPKSCPSVVDSDVSLDVLVGDKAHEEDVDFSVQNITSTSGEHSINIVDLSKHFNCPVEDPEPASSSSKTHRVNSYESFCAVSEDIYNSKFKTGLMSFEQCENEIFSQEYAEYAYAEISKLTPEELGLTVKPISFKFGSDDEEDMICLDPEDVTEIMDENEVYTSPLVSKMSDQTFYNIYASAIESERFAASATQDTPRSIYPDQPQWSGVLDTADQEFENYVKRTVSVDSIDAEVDVEELEGKIVEEEAVDGKGLEEAEKKSRKSWNETCEDDACIGEEVDEVLETALQEVVDEFKTRTSASELTTEIPSQEQEQLINNFGDGNMVADPQSFELEGKLVKEGVDKGKIGEVEVECSKEVKVEEKEESGEEEVSDEESISTDEEETADEEQGEEVMEPKPKMSAKTNAQSIKLSGKTRKVHIPADDLGIAYDTLEVPQEEFPPTPIKFTFKYYTKQDLDELMTKTLAPLAPIRTDSSLKSPLPTRFSEYDWPEFIDALDINTTRGKRAGWYANEDGLHNPRITIPQFNESTVEDDDDDDYETATDDTEEEDGVVGSGTESDAEANLTHSTRGSSCNVSELESDEEPELEPEPTPTVVEKKKSSWKFWNLFRFGRNKVAPERVIQVSA